jgi:hypothetical protein
MRITEEFAITRYKNHHKTTETQRAQRNFSVPSVFVWFYAFLIFLEPFV